MIAASMARLREVHAFLLRARRRELLPYAIAGVLLLAAIALLGEEAHQHIGSIESWIAGLGTWALIAFVFLYALLCSVFVPDVLLGITAGAAFGFGWGLAAAMAGTITGSALQYALSRQLLKPRIDRFLVTRPALAAIQSAVLAEEFHLQVLIRLTPINRAMTSYVLGVAGVGFLRFIAACAAALPYLCIEVYAGYAGRHLVKAGGQSPDTGLLHDLLMLATMGISIAVMVLIARTARRAIEAAAASTADLSPSAAIGSAPRVQ